MAAVDTSPGTVPRTSGSLPQLIDRERRRRRNRRIAFWASIAAIPVVIFAAWVLLRARPVPLAARFRTQAVTRGDIARDVHATGHVEAVSTVLVGSEISGRIATVEVDFNDRVKAGQVLARFDRTALEAQLAQARATLSAAQAGLDQAKIDLDHANRDRTRVERLYEHNTISDAERDSTVSVARLAEAKVAAAMSQMTALRSAYDVARTNLDHSIIRSPIDGVIVTRNVDPGQTVASVLQTPVLFTVAADLQKMRVIAAVDESDIGEVALRQTAAFTVNAYPTRTFEGVVTEVRNSPVVVQDVVTYGAVVAVDNADLALKPGMTASVRIRTANVQAVWRVPSSALHFTPPGQTVGTTPGVWVVDGDALRRVEVRPGISDGQLTEVAPGVVDGASVIVELTPEGKKAYGVGP